MILPGLENRGQAGFAACKRIRALVLGESRRQGLLLLQRQTSRGPEDDQPPRLRDRQVVAGQHEVAARLHIAGEERDSPPHPARRLINHVDVFSRRPVDDVASQQSPAEAE
jgi:hypothetical protein